MNRPRLISGLVVLSLALGLYVYWAGFWPLELRERVWLEIKKGLPFEVVLKKLQKKGLLRDYHLFLLYGKLTSIDRKVKSGVYMFQGSTSPFGVLKAITEGQVYLQEVTIPEGYDLWQIGSLLEKKGILSKDEFLKKAHDRDLLKKLGIEGPSAEGYLFPDTYRFALKSSPEVVIKEMYQNLLSHINDNMTKRASALGFSLHEVLTLASLIEKEAKLPEERPLISAVFHNRLKRRMPLASDPTTVYGIKPLSEGVTKEDLKRNHPYNTYLHRGLPPGPICSPGLGSIMAALYPAKVNYLYFVAKGDGAHYFSSSLREQLRAIKKFRKKTK